MLKIPFAVETVRLQTPLKRMGHVEDVAKVFVRSINNGHAFKKVYKLGNGLYYWKEIISTISSAYGKKKMTVPAPVQPIYLVALLLDRFKWFPAGRDQLNDLVNGSVCDSSELLNKYDIEPIPFDIKNLKYISG